MYAAHQPALKAAVAFYGPPRKTTDLTPQSPADIAGDVHCPVLALYGGQDKSITPDEIKKRDDICKAGGKICESKVYPDAQHGFMADYRPSYNANAAKDAWATTLAWFNKYGAAQK